MILNEIYVCIVNLCEYEEYSGDIGHKCGFLEC